MNLKNPLLDTYWFTFPDDPTFPCGLGVTAFSLEDALALLDDGGYDFHRRAIRYEVRQGISLQDIDYSHIAPNSGPLMLRGVWYPCLNDGYSSLDTAAKRHARLNPPTESAPNESHGHNIA